MPERLRRADRVPRSVEPARGSRSPAKVPGHRRSVSTATCGSAARAAAHTSVACAQGSCVGCRRVAGTCGTQACSAVAARTTAAGAGQDGTKSSAHVEPTGPPVMTLPKHLGDIREPHPVHFDIHTRQTWGSILTCPNEFLTQRVKPSVTLLVTAHAVHTTGWKAAPVPASRTDPSRAQYKTDAKGDSSS